MKSKIYYWSPFVSEVATVKSVINSAYSVNKYLNKKYESYIIDVFGEFEKFEKEIKTKNIKLIKFPKSNIINFFPNPGFLRSRVLYIFIFFRYFFPLLSLLKKDPPKIFMIHLVTSLPLFINFFFKIKTKLVLRVSGLPKLNIFRRFFWKFTFTKVDIITTPTKATLNDLMQQKITESKKILLLRDPIIVSKDIILKKNSNLIDEQIRPNEYFISIGRLSKQKNFIFLINNMKDYLTKNDMIKLIIIGEGEDKEKLLKLIEQYKLEKQILLLGFKKNIFKYLKNAKAFILTSLWEDPGFVILEAAYLNIPIISSDCPNGPKEILDNGKGGFLFKNNNENDFKDKFKDFLNTDSLEMIKKKIMVKKKTKKFSIYNHSKNLEKILHNLI